MAMLFRYTLGVDEVKILHVTDRDFPLTGDEGGAPQFVIALVDAQNKQGHEASIVTTGSSRVATIRSISARAGKDQQLQEICLDIGVDIVHFHAEADRLQPLLMKTSIMSVAHIHGLHNPELERSTNRIYVSESHAEQHGGRRYVYNGIDVQDIPYSEEPREYLAFLGKVRRSKKGAAEAIMAAKKTNHQLKIAGGRKLKIKETWLPFQSLVSTLGVLGGAEKYEFLRNAKALLFPVKWEEPFGLVMIEAMAGGTPVIAFNRGAVSEIVEDGVTGFIVEDLEGMCAAIGKIPLLNRSACRRHVQESFSIEGTARAVVACYQDALSGSIW